MSLRDLGVYNPLSENHPAVLDDTKCEICKRILGTGCRIALKPIYDKLAPEPSKTVEVKLICATCHLKGEVIMTPEGQRIVESIKYGDTPYPVITTDGKHWRDDEVGLIPEDEDLPE